MNKFVYVVSHKKKHAASSSSYHFLSSSLSFSAEVTSSCCSCDSCDVEKKWFHCSFAKFTNFESVEKSQPPSAKTYWGMFVRNRCVSIEHIYFRNFSLCDFMVNGNAAYEALKLEVRESIKYVGALASDYFSKLLFPVEESRDVCQGT